MTAEELTRYHATALAAAGRLRLPLRSRVWKGQAGEFQGAGVGSSLDFQDHRTYVPGDDPRHINWQAYARTGQYTMKLYREEVRPVVDVVLDASESMFFDPQKAQRAALDAHIARTDIVITTAQVPGRKPPLLVTASAVEGMKPGSVVVDLAASELGGNVEGSEPDKTTVLDNGVTLIGAGRLPSAMATAASTAYARNLAALLKHLVRDGELVLDADDEITGALMGGTSPTEGVSS